jgi:hypothetical protein
MLCYCMYTKRWIEALQHEYKAFQVANNKYCATLKLYVDIYGLSGSAMYGLPYWYIFGRGIGWCVVVLVVIQSAFLKYPTPLYAYVIIL